MIKYEVPNTYFVLSFFDMQSVIWLSIDQNDKLDDNRLLTYVSFFNDRCGCLICCYWTSHWRV
jgi:hypothetical protein